MKKTGYGWFKKDANCSVVITLPKAYSMVFEGGPVAVLVDFSGPIRDRRYLVAEWKGVSHG